MTSSRHSRLAKAFVGLTAAAVPTAVAVALRNHYDWEDTDAILDLVGACLVAGALGAIVGRSVTWAFATAGLVFPLLVVYYLVLMWATPDYS